MSRFSELANNVFAFIGGYRATKGQLANPRDPVLAAWFGGGDNSESGQVVNDRTAWALPAFYRAVRLRADAMASVPLPLYRRTDGENRTRDSGHWLYELLNVKPNDWQTPSEYWAMQYVHLQVRGNGYSEIVQDRQGRVAQLVPLHPDRVRPFWSKDTTGRKLPAYEHTPLDGPKRILLPGEVMHLRYDSDDGLMGRSLIQVHRESLGRDLAARANSARFMKNDLAARAWIKFPGKFEDDRARKLWRKSFEAANGGPNQGRFPVMEQGQTLETLGISAQDAGFIDSMDFSVLDIARICQVPPHKLAHMSDATFTNVEQENISWVTEGLLPWARIGEQVITRDLMTTALRRTHFAEFLLTGLLRGDSAARGEFYNKLFMLASLSPNDIRRAENMNTIGPAGDRYFIQGAMVPVDRVDQVLDRQKGSQGQRDMDALAAELRARGLSDNEVDLWRRLIEQAPGELIEAPQPVLDLRNMINGGANGHG